MQLVRYMAVAALAVAVTAVPARAQDVDALLRRAADTYTASRTAKARFEQTITNPMTGSTVMARGELQRQEPNKFDIRFTDPAGDRIVSDGTHLWVYVPSTNPGQVIKMPLAATAGAVPMDLGAQFFTKPTTRFTVKDAGIAKVDGRATRALVLTPKQAGEAFTRATVWLDEKDGTLRQFEMVDGMGLTRLVRILGLTANAPVKASTFTFRPPAGVRIVDQQALLGGGRP